MLIAAGLCVVFAVIAAVGIRFVHLRGIAAYLVAVLPALPIAAALVWTGVYLDEEKDEFQRNLLIQSILGGIGATLIVTTAWGYLEDFTHVSPLPLSMVYPMFWVFTGISFPVVRMRYR
jgi:hypothetical protein